MVEQVWQNILASDEMGEALVASHEVDDVVSLMIESKISPQKFIGNFSALVTRGMPTMNDLLGTENSGLLTTPSINQYISPLNRPFSPLWLLSGFPDVLTWVNKKQVDSSNKDDSASTIANLFGFDENGSEDISEFENPDGSLKACCYHNLIRNYVEQTGQNLEVAVEDDAEDDIYLQNDFLQMAGEESNFTLIATITTKYYMELKTRYAFSFPNETSLLSMTGILDANAYILSTGQIKPIQIVDLANSTQGKEDRLLEFMVQFEALLLSIDTPEVSPDEVLTTCYEQKDAIQQSISDVLSNYRSEPQIANTVRAFMTSAQFSQLRNTAGIRPPSLLSRIKNIIFN